MSHSDRKEISELMYVSFFLIQPHLSSELMKPVVIMDCCSHLLEVLDSFEVEPLLIEQLQVFVIQLISPHFVLLLLLLHLVKAYVQKASVCCGGK